MKRVLLPLPAHSEGRALKVAPGEQNYHLSRSQTALNIAVLDFSNIDGQISLRRFTRAEKVREREVVVSGSEPEGRSHRRPLGRPSLSLPGLP